MPRHYLCEVEADADAGAVIFGAAETAAAVSGGDVEGLSKVE
jgi:hypothetical protein